jgi:hypothetical protein
MFKIKEKNKPYVNVSLIDEPKIEKDNDVKKK